MKKYVFAKRTMYVFKREDGPFSEETIMALDPRFITEKRCVAIEVPDPKPEPKKVEKPMDLNKDGKVDKKDVSLAAKVMRKVRHKKGKK